MKTINNNTQKAQAYINAYNRSSMYDLHDAYKNPSDAKKCADYDCRMMMQSEGGHGYKIIRHTCNFFTAGWIAGDALRIETYRNSFVIPETVE